MSEAPVVANGLSAADLESDSEATHAGTDTGTDTESVASTRSTERNKRRKERKKASKKALISARAALSNGTTAGSSEQVSAAADGVPPVSALLNGLAVPSLSSRHGSLSRV